MCGLTGLPGLLDSKLPPLSDIIGGTALSCLLEELLLRWRSNELFRLSLNAALLSRMRWYLLSAAVVRAIVASLALSSVRLKLFSSFFCSSNLRKSFRLSSSVCMLPELLPAAPLVPVTATSGVLVSTRVEEEAEPLPLLLWPPPAGSPSSVLEFDPPVPVPAEVELKRLRRLEKELL